VTSPRPLFLDCDPGIDDALALGYLLSRPEVDIVGIGTVSGNVSAGEAAANTAALLALAGRSDIPVAVGSHDPLVGSFSGGARHVHGENGFGGVELEPGAALVDEDAAELLVRLARDLGGELEVLAVGPLTNLARALQLEPQLPQLVARLTIMGGAVWTRGNITPFAEANIYNDAEAAAQVLAAGFAAVLVPLDVTMRHHFDDAEVDLFSASDSPVPVALGGMLTHYLDFYEAGSGERRAPLHDPLAALLAVDPAVSVEVREVTVEVPSAGAERGRTVPRDPIPGRTVGVVVAARPDAADLLRATLLQVPTVRRHGHVTGLDRRDGAAGLGRRDGAAGRDRRDGAAGRYRRDGVVPDGVSAGRRGG
jgi:purine nucleosidase